MTELSQTILKDYQVRKNKKQKNAFISILKEHFPNLKIERSGLIKSSNLIIGDVDKAKVVFTAHYDTCARLPIPNFIAPKNVLVSLLYSFLLVLPMMIVLFLLNYPITLLSDNFWVNYVITLIFAAAIMALMIAGPANKHNANDNTSGVILLLEIISNMSPEELEQTAFVFFDNEEIGLLGSSQFKKRYAKQMESKLLVNFDCVSDGDHMLIAASKSASQKYGKTMEEAFQPDEGKTVAFGRSDKIFYPSDHIGFPTSISVAAFHKKKFIGHYISRIHTKRDTIFDENNITMLRNNSILLAQKMSQQ